MIALGFAGLAGLGALVRWWAVRWNAQIPWGTFTVNVAGAFLAGVLVSLDQGQATVVIGGGFGSLTTFSTLMVEVTDRARSGPVRLLYLIATLLSGIGAAWLGLTIA